ncbi:hypothetical protein KKG36_01325 [Patescibacteria group bacterium]|nr:hypothetical protein [Patescibacteria group bacterium]
MSLVDEMRNLREDIDSGKEIRTRRLNELKKDLAAFIKDSTGKRKEDFNTLQSGLKIFITDLKKDVKATAEENQAAQQELKKMLADAQAVFWGKQKTEEEKKEEEKEE